MGAFLQHRQFCHWHLDQFPDEEEEASGFEEEGRLILFRFLGTIANSISSTMVMMDGVMGAVNRAGRTTRGLDIRNVMNGWSLGIKIICKQFWGKWLSIQSCPLPIYTIRHVKFICGNFYCLVVYRTRFSTIEQYPLPSFDNVLDYPTHRQIISLSSLRCIVSES